MNVLALPLCDWTGKC